MHSFLPSLAKRRPRVLYKLAFLGGWLVGASVQGQLLETVPADIAAVTVIRSPRALLEKANAAIKRVKPDAPPITWADVERRLGPSAAGFCDIDQPLIIVLTRAEGEGGLLVVGSRVDPPDNAVGGPAIYSSPRGAAVSSSPDRFYAKAGKITYVAPRRRPLRGFSRLKPSTSLAAEMDPEQRAIARSSDLFVYVRMEAWQDRIRPYVQFVSAMAKFSVTAEPSENPAEQKMRTEVTNWFIDGAVSVLDQMSSVSLGLALDGESIRLRHHHAFVAGGSVAKYVSGTRASDVPPWACLPDRPFIAAFSTNWWSPDQSSIMLEMTRKVFDAVGDGAANSPTVKKKVIDSTAACYGNMRGMNMMMTLDNAEEPHMEMFGSYAYVDADEGLRQMLLIQANASEAMSAITPGGFVGKNVEKTHDGVTFNEVSLDASGVGEALRAEMEAVYGPDARVRQAKVGPKRVAACVNQSVDDFVNLVKSGETAQPLLSNTRVKKLISGMQEGAQSWLVLDIQRLMKLAGAVVSSQADKARAGKPGGKVGIQITGGKPGAKKKLPADAPATQSGPLLGWSAKAGDRSFTGEFLITLDDAAAAARMTEDMMEQFRDKSEDE